MTKIGAWKCDICKEIFTDKNNFSLEIDINFEYEKDWVSFTFEDTCEKCRKNIVIAIENLIVVEKE